MQDHLWESCGSVVSPDDLCRSLICLHRLSGSSVFSSGREDLRCWRLMLVSCHLCDVITWWELKLSALKIVVLSVSDRGLPCHEFEPSTTKDPPYESRFSLSSDSHRILIWRERGSRNHPSDIIERDRYGGRGVLVLGGIMLGSRTDLHIFDAGSVYRTRYCNEILLPYVRLFRGAMGLQFLFIDDNAPCHCTVAFEQLLESEDIERMDWPA
ncbi:transposable element Tcb2 transposase [Trichonephila clavipes]|nr:transposable element Tcb2 transposase [Trichonephila clavipes]